MRKRLPFGLTEAGLTDYRSPGERDFLEALHARAKTAGWYADAWPRANSITLSLVLNDASTGQLSETLRIDFDGKNIVVGRDATHQLLGEGEEWGPSMLDDDDGRRSIRELAAAAASWIEEQLAIDHSKQDDHVLELPVPMSRRKPRLVTPLLGGGTPGRVGMLDVSPAFPLG